MVGSHTLEERISDASFDSELVSLLSSKVDEVGSHAVLLTTPQLVHTESLVENTTGSEVLVGFWRYSVQFVDTVVMCSSVISSRTPHRISTT